MRISDWSSDVCSSDLGAPPVSRSCAGAHSGATASPAKRRAQVRSCIDKRRARGVSTAVAVADRIAALAAEGAPRHLRTRRSEEHTSELQSLLPISYAVFCFKTHNSQNNTCYNIHHTISDL